MALVVITPNAITGWSGTIWHMKTKERVQYLVEVLIPLCYFLMEIVRGII
jgi:hypothetical protein